MLLESLDGGAPLKVMAATADVDEVNSVVESLVVEVEVPAGVGRKVPAFDTDDMT